MGTRRPAYLLMDVVISIAMLLFGMTFIGAQVQKTQDSAYESENLTKILMLAESKLAELDTGLIRLEEEADDEIEGDFTLRFPDYGWRLHVFETATESLRAFTLEILHAPRESPEEEFDHDNAEVVHRVHTMRADPPLLDMQTDMGLTEEMIVELSDTLPVEFFDPPFFDPSILPQLEMEDLMELMPSLVGLFGDNANALIASFPPEFREMVELGLGGDAGEGVVSDPSSEVTDEDLEMFEMTREEYERLQESEGQNR